LIAAEMRRFRERTVGASSRSGRARRPLSEARPLAAAGPLRCAVRASSALATVLVLSLPAAAAPDEGLRIVGTNVADAGWPALGKARPGTVEAGREAAAPVRALPLAADERAPDSSAERAAALTLAETLRNAHADRRHDRGGPPARAVDVVPGPVDRRLRPEEILFDVPRPGRALAAPTATRALRREVPVPAGSPDRRVDAPIPRAHPRRGLQGAGDEAPIPRPAPRAATRRGNPEDDAARSVDLSLSSDRGKAAATTAVPVPVPWERSGAGDTPRAAAVAPFLALWPDTRVNEETTDADADPPAPLPPGPEPSELVRMLTAVQDDIARGAGAAQRAQTVLQRRIAERFAAAEPREWRQPRNARALVIYALSGGSPAVVRGVLEYADLERPFDSLAAGALAYLEGRAADSRRHFAAVDDVPLDHSLAGSVHLARAALAVEVDPSQALDLLERARAAAPATLVEEAALRRALLVAARLDDMASFDGVVDRYLRKFRASLYAGNFRQRLASALTRMSVIEEPAAFVRLETMLEPMTDAGRQELYLLLARAAIESGNRVAAEIAAERARETARSGTLDARRAELYRAAAQVVDPKAFATALATLEKLEDADLPEDDRALLFAALRLSRTMTDLPEPPDDRSAGEATAAALPDGEAARGRGMGTLGGSTKDPAAPADPETTSTSEDMPVARASFDVAAVERRVAEALAEVDALLEDTP